MSIHPLALVSPQARVGRDVQIGPFCVVEEGVTIEEGCTLGCHVVIKGPTVLGPDNHIFDGTVIGGLPQHAHMPERSGKIVIGRGNVIRETCTIHRALKENETTTVGDNNLLMVGTHVAHDCRVGSNVIVTNNTLLGGHVTVEDRANVSGAVAVHQFCRIGSLAMVGGQAHVIKDIPPYVTVDGLSSYVVGLNYIGLRRAGFSGAEIQQIKDAYRLIYRSGLAWKTLLARLRTEFVEGPAARFYEFLSTTSRGIINERRLPPGATIKLRRDPDEEQGGQAKAKAG